MSLAPEKESAASVLVIIEKIMKLLAVCFHLRLKRHMTVHWKGWHVVIVNNDEFR